MELYTKIAFNKAIEKCPEIIGKILNKSTRSEGVKELSEKSGLALSFLELNFEEIKRKLILTTI